MGYYDKLFNFGKHKVLGLDNLNLLPKSFVSTNTIFIHIPKCAGQSVGQAFYGHTIHHQKAGHYMKVAPRFYSQAFVFSCVRDPVDRFFSAYHYLKNGGRSKRDAYIIQKYIKGKTPTDVLDFLTETSFDENADLVHFHTQTSFLSNPDNPRLILVDRVYNIKHLSALMEDFNRVSKHPSILKDFPLVNISRKNQVDDIDNNLINKIRDLYNIDYVNFF